MSETSRRQFLEHSMLVAAAAVTHRGPEAVAVPIETGFQADQRSVNDRLGVAVIGLRGRGGSHIGAFAGRKDTEVLYLCDVDLRVAAKRLKEVEKRQGSRPSFVTDMRRLLDDPRVDIVSIATPNHLHALQAIWALKAGKDVYLESPVSHNMSEGRLIVEAARKYGRICQAGMQSRSNPGVRSAIEFLQSGSLGDVRVARGICFQRRQSIGPYQNYSLPRGVDYDLWLGPAPLSSLNRRQLHYDWRWQSAYGNGELGNQGVHQMDLARWGLAVDTLSRSVLSYGGRFGKSDAGDTADSQVVLHDFGPQLLVFEVRTLPTKAVLGVKVGVIFECSEGYLVLQGNSKGTALDRNGRTVAEFRGGADHFANFIKAVRSRRATDLHADILEGHLSSSLCHLGNVSYQMGAPSPWQVPSERWGRFQSRVEARETFERFRGYIADAAQREQRDGLRFGQILEIDPIAERLVDCPAADAVVTRDYRPPFVVPVEGTI